MLTDHRSLEAGWRRLRIPLAQIADGQPAELPADTLEAFVSLYESHMQREEDELMPMAARLLSDADITRIGQAMRHRRSIGDEML